MSGPSPAMAALLWGFAVAGSLGVPRLYRVGCLARGRCCVDFRAAQLAPWPSHKPFTSIYSRTDAAVSWRACRVDGAHHTEVADGHVAQLTAASVQRAVSEALARPVLAPVAAA